MPDLELGKYNIKWPEMTFEGSVKVVRLYKKTERWFNGPPIETDLVDFTISFPEDEPYRFSLPIKEFKTYIK